MELGTLSPYNVSNAKLIHFFENITIENVVECIVPLVLFLGCCNTQFCPSGSTAYLRRRLLSSHLLSHLPATCVSQESNNWANLLFDTCALYKRVPEYSCVCDNLALSHEGANIIIRRLASIMPPTPHNTHSVTHSLYKSIILGSRVTRKEQ